MGFFGFILCGCVICLSALVAQDDVLPSLEKQDIEALRAWVKEKKQQVTVQDRGGKLSIGGEVRVELQSTNEKKNGIKQRGSGGAVDNVAMRAWDIEVNLMLDYRTDRTWTTVKLEFDNNAGTVSGTFNRLSLERALFGARIVNGDTYNMDLVIGRRLFAYTFDSKIEFGSFMDGILYLYDQALDDVGDLYFHGGPFLVDETLDHYGYVGEIGLLSIGRTGLYSKLSYINWDTKNTGNEQRDLAFKFQNIQLLLGYKCEPKWIGKTTTLYAAGLVNAAAGRPKVIGLTSKQNLAWYAGFSIGTLRKQWDWSCDINYQWVQLQAVPDFDGLGIGRGNAAGIGLYSTRSKGLGNPIGPNTGVGRSNYKGISIEFLLNLTNNITLYQSWNQSVNQNPSILPTFSYKQYEVEIIYTF